MRQMSAQLLPTGTGYNFADSILAWDESSVGTRRVKEGEKQVEMSRDQVHKMAIGRTNSFISSWFERPWIWQDRKESLTSVLRSRVPHYHRLNEVWVIKVSEFLLFSRSRQLNIVNLTENVLLSPHLSLKLIKFNDSIAHQIKIAR